MEPMNRPTESDSAFMAAALRLARRGLYTTDPNPRVGCLIVRAGAVVGSGFHARAGGPHAEVVALREAGDAARGATVYVSLEPCAHEGRTPPCTEALIAAGVARVVAAVRDPDPRAAGGLDRLAAAGIETVAGLLEGEATALNPGFLKRARTGLPWVRVKLAMSLDGRTALASGASRWITGEAARRDVQFLRARSSAVLTGIGTVRADDPRLDVRLTAAELAIAGEVRQPLRVVLDPALELSPRAHLAAPGTLVFGADGADPAAADGLRAAGVEVAGLPLAGEGVDLETALRELARRGMNEIHVEAGPTLGGALLTAGLVDEIVVYMAPHLLGDGARGLFHLPAIVRMDERLPLRITDIRAVGDDWRIIAVPVVKG